jgi:hypothetical protein
MALARKHLLPKRRPEASTASNCAGLVNRPLRFLLAQTRELVKR